MIGPKPKTTEPPEPHEDLAIPDSPRVKIKPSKWTGTEDEGIEIVDDDEDEESA